MMQNKLGILMNLLWVRWPDMMISAVKEKISSTHSNQLVIALWRSLWQLMMSIVMEVDTSLAMLEWARWKSVATKFQNLHDSMITIWPKLRKKAYIKKLNILWLIRNSTLYSVVTTEDYQQSFHEHLMNIQNTSGSNCSIISTRALRRTRTLGTWTRWSSPYKIRKEWISSLFRWP